MSHQPGVKELDEIECRACVNQTLERKVLVQCWSGGVRAGESYGGHPTPSLLADDT